MTAITVKFYIINFSIADIHDFVIVISSKSLQQSNNRNNFF